jgi:hypothetical protein
MVLIQIEANVKLGDTNRAHALARRFASSYPADAWRLEKLRF